MQLNVLETPQDRAELQSKQPFPYLLLLQAQPKTPAPRWYDQRNHTDPTPFFSQRNATQICQYEIRQALRNLISCLLAN